MALYRFLHRGVDWENDTIKVAYFTGDHVYDVNDVFFSDISANEVSGSGYTSGGFTLANCSAVAESDGFDKWDADDTNNGNMTVTNATYYVIYKDSGDPATSVLIRSTEFRNGPYSPDNDVLDIEFSDRGILRLRYDW